MKAEYTDVFYADGQEIIGLPKTVALPFRHLSARAIIVRRKDGFILGTLHRQDGKFALPGGAVEDGESTAQAVKRELAEENIILTNPDWDPRVAVDYYDGYKELSVWHIAIVDDAEIGFSEENVESKWLAQDEDVWYPYMHETLILILNRYLPDLSMTSVFIQNG